MKIQKETESQSLIASRAYMHTHTCNIHTYEHTYTIRLIYTFITHTQKQTTEHHFYERYAKSEEFIQR